MQSYGILGVLVCICFEATKAQCSGGQTLTFSRWSGASPERPTPVFIYTAGAEETSLTGACLARCRELKDCAAVAVAFGRGTCTGVAGGAGGAEELRVDSDVAYFQKICLDLPESCSHRWWVLEVTPGYQLHSEGAHQKMLNATIQECYAAVLTPRSERLYRSAQWVGPANGVDAELVQTSDRAVGSCLLNAEDKFTEPESYRVANYQTFYVENQCRHDYSKKIDRCSYEEYYNQTLRHVEYSLPNNTKDECKTACELEQRFVCRGFTWSRSPGRAGGDTGRAGGDTGRAGGVSGRGLCDLHSEDLVTTGSWLLRKSTFATYYRRVICLNITVECEDANLVVTYRPRGAFRGRVYVPGRGERCAARASNGLVRLPLPLYGDCDVNFAHAISQGPSGVINRTMAYVMVMIQNNPIIQTAGDRWVRVGCSPGAGAGPGPGPGPAAVDATIAVRDQSKPSSASEIPAGQSASAVFDSPRPALSMYVVRDDPPPAPPAPAAAPAVALGEPLELRVELQDSTEIEAYHLVASSRLGDSSVLLLDSSGCPTGQVDFPEFRRSWLGGTQRLSARFKAFRFPTSHVVRFALMVRYCDVTCPPLNCLSKSNRSARMTNATEGSPAWVTEESPEAWAGGVVAQGGEAACGGRGRTPLELELVVGSKDLLSADTLVRADHRSAGDEAPDTVAAGAAGAAGVGVVCVHELLLVALALAWLAVQVLLLLGCCVLVKRYRNLAETSMQKEYQTFDNVGFDTVSTHRRVHWPDESHILHTTQ